MKVSIVRNWQEFGNLESEWDTLLERSRARSIFLTWEWIRAWRMAIDDAVSPYVLVVRQKTGDLVGIIPFYVASMTALGMINYRALRFMADTATGAEYADWIIDASVEEDVATEIAKGLARNAHDWDVIWMPNISGWTGAETRIFYPAMKEGLVVQRRKRVFSAISLPPSQPEFENRFSASRRQQMRRKTRRVMECTDTTITRCEHNGELPQYLDALFEQHQRRWASVGIDGCFVSKPAEKAFYRLYSPVAMENGSLWIFALKQGSEFKAVQFGYVDGDAFLQLQEGYDPSYQDGVGNVLRQHVVEQCIEAGLKVYDFLGGVSEHKRRWTAEERVGFDVLIGSPSLKTKLLTSFDIWPTGRAIRQKGLVTGK